MKKNILQLWLTAFCMILLHGNALAAEPSGKVAFDHDKTGYFLNGQHISVACESCHIRGIFRGTPKTCNGCHTQGSPIASSIKSISHVQTRAQCDDCHTESSWDTVRMDHGSLTGSCSTCHNGSSNTGKPANHVASSNECSSCHLSIAWIPARFDHGTITAQCSSCHNGVTATGKTPTHIQSSNTCDDCHGTRGWTPARFDHGSVTATCYSCHNGTTATGKNRTHITSDNTCNNCHTTSGWTPAGFDHSNVSGNCSSCHNGVQATGKGQNHFVTTLQCDTCHRTTAWVPALTFSHTSANYPGNHTGSNPACNDCHTANSQTITYAYPQYGTECAACHAGDYRSDKHESCAITATTCNNISMSGFYNCAGTCHKSTPEHRVSGSDW
ncbi:MAG: Cytochrome protein [Pseudomonadota bacterium]|nr:Cytochrome protein [Pseudomonadota bacterium]